MQHTSRKQFLQTSAMLAAGAVVGFSFTNKKAPLNLSFSTLACPEWTFEQVVKFAAAHGYKALEIRGILKQMDLPKIPEFSTPENIASTMALMKQNGLQFINLGSSSTLHFADETKRKDNLEEGRRCIDLAQKLNCPFIRVYPNLFPKEQDKQATIQLIASGLKELDDYAKGKNVLVLMETHGDAVHVDDLVAIMEGANHPQTGLIWDICNMWTITKEPPAMVYSKLKKYIHHTHIKDAKLLDGKPQYVFMGKGDVPIFEAIDILRNDGYKGFFSFEWEKLWHPELAAPELALADYPEAMKKHLTGS